MERGPVRWSERLHQSCRQLHAGAPPRQREEGCGGDFEQQSMERLLLSADFLGAGTFAQNE